MIRALLAVIVWCSLAASAHAWPVHGTGVVVVSCAGSTLPDGCSGDPIGLTGNFLNPSFFNASSTPAPIGGMRQSGQGAYTVTPLTAATPQNVAGVSAAYRLGLPSTIFTGSISGTTLTVSTIQTGALAIGMTLDEGQGFVLQGTHILSGSGSTWTVDKSQTVSLNTLYAQALVSPSALSTVINGSNTGAANCPGATFSSTGGPGSTQLLTLPAGSCTLTLVDLSHSDITGHATSIFWGNTTSAVTLNYPKIVSDIALNQGTGSLGFTYAFQIRVSSGAHTLTTLGGIYDGCATVDNYCPQGMNNYLNASGTYPSLIMTDGGTMTRRTSTYGVWVNVDGRYFGQAHNSATGDTYDTNFNYACGFAYGTNAPHGEFDLQGADATTIAHIGFQYNTMCNPANATGSSDGLIVTANAYNGSTTIDGITAGSLSALKAAGAQVVTSFASPSLFPANTALSFYGTGSAGGVGCTTGATAATATCVGLTKAATATTLASVAIYGGAGSGNATTGFITPWGGGTFKVLDTQVVGNVAISNQAPPFGGSVSLCSAPGASTGPCFATAGTLLTQLEFVTYGTLNNSGNYTDATGSFSTYNIPTTVLSGASISGTTLTAAVNTLQNGFWVIDNANSTLNGGAPVTITSAPSGTGPYTYTISAAPGTVGPETMYVREAIATVATSNINMIDGAVCNPNPIAQLDSCTGVHH
jgi:hypothetical protein